MKRFSVVIAGGGVAALEGLLRLHRLAGDRVAITLLAPDDHFLYRALAVNEPFSLGSPKHHPLAEIVRDTDAVWLRESLSSVEPAAGLVLTSGGETISFDALLVAVGARLHPPFDYVKTFIDRHADKLFRGVVQDVEDGYVKRPVFIGPPGPAWPLPLYELALMTAERGSDSGSDLDVTLVTAEAEPLPAFGGDVSAGVRDMLQAAGVNLLTSSEVEVKAKGELIINPSGMILHPDSAIAMPRMTGPAVPGIPGDQHGFVPIEPDCCVPGTGGRVFAAGDCIESPLKHGGVGAQHADIAAAAIARMAGAAVEVPPYNLILRGKLLTGARPKYLWARQVDGKACDSVISDNPIDGWDQQVAAAELAPYLEHFGATHAGQTGLPDTGGEKGST